MSTVPDLSQAENIAQAIRLTQKLRASVAHVFNNLSDGVSASQGNEKQVLNEFHERLMTVNNDVGELEKVGANLQSLSSVTPNSIHLSIDPAIDKSPVYSQILQAYRWSNKVSELAGHAAAMLDQHVKFKRTQPMGMMQTKKLKRTPPTGHAIGLEAVKTFVARINQKTADCSVVISHPLGSFAVLQITIGRILKAHVALRGLMIEWVNVRGYHEENPDESKLELWTKSRYQVFQKVTESAIAATLYFYSPHNAELSLHSFILWFQRYKTLFSSACHKCGKHYLNGLPPTWRDLRTTDAYHDMCRQ